MILDLLLRDAGSPLTSIFFLTSPMNLAGSFSLDCLHDLEAFLDFCIVIWYLAANIPLADISHYNIIKISLSEGNFSPILLECAHGISVPLNCSGKERKNQWTLDIKCNSLLTQGSHTLASWKNSPLKAVCNSHSSFPRIWTERKRKYTACAFIYNIFPFQTSIVIAGKQNAVSTVRIFSFSFWMIKVWMVKHSLKKNKNIHFLAQPSGCS